LEETVVAASLPLSRFARRVRPFAGVGRGTRTAYLVMTVAVLLNGLAAAEAPSNSESVRKEEFAVHGQITYVEQETNDFPSPYRGPNSLSPNEGRQTFDATLYLGARLWEGAEGWITPEIDQGFGLNDTLGVAGFPSGEAYKVGKKEPYLRLPRAFVRQTVDLDGAQQAFERGLIQLGGSQSANRIVVTIGKFSVTDVFDTNQFAHDPRSDFMNWVAIDAGSFDYAADAWGFTVGATVEWYQGAWTLRGGVFDMSGVPNSEHLDPGGHEFQMILELERRFELDGQPGRVFVTGYDSRARMGLLDDAVHLAQATGGPVDIAAVRRYRNRMGIHAALEQRITADLGAFARVGGAAGNVETYEFTDIDRFSSAGLTLKGSRWHRTDDTVGLAAIVNAISAERRRFLDAGGLGILIGDGQLPHPATERILEAYYSAKVVGQAYFTLDCQFVTNPAYNHDRSPVAVLAVRLHSQF
jgi:high affinity Mn2+ porin